MLLFTGLVFSNLGHIPNSKRTEADILQKTEARGCV